MKISAVLLFFLFPFTNKRSSEKLLKGEAVFVFSICSLYDPTLKQNVCCIADPRTGPVPFPLITALMVAAAKPTADLSGWTAKQCAYHTAQLKVPLASSTELLLGVCTVRWTFCDQS